MILNAEQKQWFNTALLLLISTLLAACTEKPKVVETNNVSTKNVSANKATDSGATQRRVAITIDDLPSVGRLDISQKRQLTQTLLEKLVEARVPAIGFVNENKLGEPEPRVNNIALLQAWVDAGMALGNHTYSHPKFYDTNLEEFKQQVLLGERVTKKLFTPKEGEVRFFRHPYLNTGPDMETRVAFEYFLSEQNYRVAPVTIDNSEWIYAKAYNMAGKADDVDLQKRIAQDYLRYMLGEFEFYEQLSRDLLGREPAQILLLHANQLNADYIDQLLAAITERGYTFLSLHEVLKDPAYEHTDNYTGSSGISWLQRWWISEGNSRRAEPEAADWVQKVAFSDK